jgi:hypothetical protein
MAKLTTSTLSVFIALFAFAPPGAALAAPPAGSGGAAGSFPLLLLQGPGWRVQHANVERRRKGVEGSIEFVTGKPIPYETIKILGPKEHPREKGMFPASVRQRRVEVSWRYESLDEAVERQRSGIHPRGQKWVELPVLGTTAKVDTRAEFYSNQGGPGNRQMTAFWEEDGRLVELRAAVPDQAAFEARLDWLAKVDEATWLAAMPSTVVAPAEHDAAVAEMLRGIPTPKSFKPSRVRDEGLPTARYQVGAAVTGTVSCLWFRQWGEARRIGDGAAEAEAVKAMATARHWRVLHQMDAEGDYPEVVWELAREMPSGVWTWYGKTHPLLPKAEALGCARLGIPLLPSKQKAQRERGTPPPPAKASALMGRKPVI